MHGMLDGRKKTFSWTPDKDDLLAELAESGMTSTNAAEKLGVSKNSAISRGRKIGVHFCSNESNVMQQARTDEAELRAKMEAATDRFLSLLVRHHPEQLKIKWRVVDVELPVAHEQPDEAETTPSPVIGGEKIKFPSLANVISQVAEFYGLSFTEIVAWRRTAGTALVRQVAMLICRDMTPNSYPEIAQAFGRDHSTVIHGVKIITHLMATDERLRDEIEIIKLRIRDAMLNA